MAEGTPKTTVSAHSRRYPSTVRCSHWHTLCCVGGQLCLAALCLCLVLGRIAPSFNVLRVSVHDITVDRFTEFVRASMPVVIAGAATQWPAFEKWSDEYLARVAGTATVHVETVPRDVHTFAPLLSTWRDVNMTMAQFLAAYSSDGTWVRCGAAVANVVDPNLRPAGHRHSPRAQHAAS